MILLGRILVKHHQNAQGTLISIKEFLVELCVQVRKEETLEGLQQTSRPQATKGARRGTESRVWVALRSPAVPSAIPECLLFHLMGSPCLPGPHANSIISSPSPLRLGPGAWAGKPYLGATLCYLRDNLGRGGAAPQCSWCCK